MQNPVLPTIVALMTGLLATNGFCVEVDTAFAIDTLYPGLTSGAFCFATVGELPANTLVRAGSLEFTTEALEAEIAQSPEKTRETNKKNAFFVLEQMVSKRLLLEAAKQQAMEAKKDIAALSEKDLLGEYARGLVSSVQASDEEVAAFYEKNKEACGGAALEQIKDDLKNYVINEKQQDLFREHIRTAGKRTPIVLSAAWTKAQTENVKDNPVDKARVSGKPSLVDFGSTGCRPCDMMAPILEDMKKKYEGKANVIFVHVMEDQFLAKRYGVQSIPVQVFFDAGGKEVYRHTGFFPQVECEKRLAEIGVK